MSWFLYIAKCKDDTLYTGITTDPERRESEHNRNNKLGARSLIAKRPIKIVYIEKFTNQFEARRREVEIKGWKRVYKLKLINGNTGFTRKFSAENVSGP